MAKFPRRVHSLRCSDTSGRTSASSDQSHKPQLLLGGIDRGIGPLRCHKTVCLIIMMLNRTRITIREQGEGSPEVRREFERCRRGRCVAESMRTDGNAKDAHCVLPYPCGNVAGGEGQTVFGYPEMVFQFRGWNAPTGEQCRALGSQISIEEQAQIFGDYPINGLAVLGLARRHLNAPTAAVLPPEVYAEAQACKVLEPERPEREEGDDHAVAHLDMAQVRPNERLGPGVGHQGNSEL